MPILPAAWKHRVYSQSKVLPTHLLQLGVGGHAALGVALRQLKHAVVEAVEARQRHKLELVAHGAQLLHPHRYESNLCFAINDCNLTDKNLQHAGHCEEQAGTGLNTHS